MTKSRIALVAAFSLIAGAAFAGGQNGNNGNGNNCQGNSCGGVTAPSFGAAFGAIGGASFSGTATGTFAKNRQTGAGTGYAQTEAFGNAGAEIQAGTNLPFRANGFANSGSQSASGSQVNNGNGSVRNVTGGFGASAAGIGAGVAFGTR